MEKKVIKFYAHWCGPCKVYAPTFDRVKNDLQDVVEFVEVDVEQDTDNLSGQYKVRGIPMTILLQGDKVVKTHSGRMTEDELKQFILN